MRYLIFSALLFFCFSCASGNPDIEETPGNQDTPEDSVKPGTPADTTTVLAAFFAKGADISWVTEMEAKGYKFYNAAGEERECTALMKELGLNAVRYRVWVNPADGYCNAQDVLTKALRAQALGMKIMIDFHYSDSWADPGKQPVPEAWKSYTVAQTADALSRHTKETLQLLNDNGVDVTWVQVGNEVTAGMLWETGRVAGNSIGSFGTYFKSGYDAVKSVYPQALVVLHIDNGWNTSTVEWFFNLMKAKSVEYDVAGFSLYPSYWESGGYPDWTTKTKQFVAQVKSFKSIYGKPVILAEFGMPASEPVKAKAALQYIIDNTKELDYFGGIFYWEPESEKSRNGYDYGAFADGRPTEALDPFK